MNQPNLPSDDIDDVPGSLSDWRGIAEWDWVWAKKTDCIHAIAELYNEETVDWDWQGNGVTECGIKYDRFTIPGVFERMSVARCPKCCEKTGMPQGNQSPKNVDECRPIVEKRLEKLRGVPLREPAPVAGGKGEG